MSLASMDQEFEYATALLSTGSCHGGNPIAFSVVPDQRGEGFGIYRKDDHPSVDLSKLSGDERVQFAHPGGFVAKTKAKMSISELIELIEPAITV